MSERRIIQFAAILMVFAALFSASGGHRVFKTFAPDGPYKVGVKILHLELGGRKAPVMIWYPNASASPIPITPPRCSNKTPSIMVRVM